MNIRFLQCIWNKQYIIDEFNKQNWKTLMNTWRLFGSMILNEERKIRESNQQIVVYQASEHKRDIQFNMLVPLYLQSDRLLEEIRREQLAIRALSVEPNHKYYSDIIQPDSWIDQPCKFDHVINNGNERIYAPVKTTYPLTLQNGYELIALWKYEHLKRLCKDDKTIDQQRLDFLKSQFIYSNLLRRLNDDDDNLDYLFNRNMFEECEFYNLMKTGTCSDWNKMNVQGESYVGYYQSENPIERDNAWNLTWEDNFKYVFNTLKKKNYYPLSIMYVIQYLCALRCESPVEVIEFYEFFINSIINPNYESLITTDKHLRFIY